MIEEFEQKMKAGYNLKELIAEVDKDLKEVRKWRSEADDSFINQVDQFMHEHKGTNETLK